MINKWMRWAMVDEMNDRTLVSEKNGMDFGL